MFVPSAISRKLSIFAVFGASFSAIFLLAVEPAFAASATLSLDPTTVSTTTGQSFTLNVNVDTGGEPTDGTRAIVEYDPAFLTFAGVTDGTIYGNYPANGQVADTTNGQITIAGIVNAGSTFSGSGLLASINFTAAAAGTTTVKFDFVGPYDPNNPATSQDSNVADSNPQNGILDILTQTTTTSVTIAAASGNATPAAPTTAPAASQSASTNPVVTPTPQQLPNTANTSPTLALAAIGGVLVALGASLFFVF